MKRKRKGKKGKCIWDVMYNYQAQGTSLELPLTVPRAFLAFNMVDSLDYEQSPMFVLSLESLLLFITYLHNFTFSLPARGFVVQANVYEERRMTANGLPVGI